MKSHMFNLTFTVIVFTIMHNICFADTHLNDEVFVSAYGSERLTAKQISRDVNLLKKTYAKIHPGYTRYASEQDLSNAWQSIISQANAEQGMSIETFYLSVQKALTLIRCDHTKANLPKAMRQERNTQAVYLPFRWVWVENRAIVTQVDKNNKLYQYDEILQVDGQAITDLVKQVKQYIPVDGYTEWSRNSGIASSLEFQGGAVDHFGAMLWQVYPEVNLTILRNNQEISITLSRINYKQWLALGEASVRNFKDAVNYKAIDENIAYLRIDTFVNYRHPVKPEDIYNPVFKTIKEAKQKVLIVDLRKNGGGSSDASMGLLSNLITKKTYFKRDMYVNTLSFADVREHLSTWDKRALNPSRIGFSKNDNGTYSLRSWFTDELDIIKPAKYAFNGKLILLTSNSNSSGSTNLLAVVKAQENAMLVGEKTGGSAEGVTAGVLFTVTLPESKITTRLPFFRYENNVDTFERGMGVTPDISAPLTVDALVNDQDLALEAAIRFAHQH